MKKKFLSIAVCLCMILTMIPGGALQPDAAWAAGHTSHCVCGGISDIDNHTHNFDTEWTGVSDLSGITQAGYYYLTDNVTLTETWKPVDGVVLCLNGKTITADGDFEAVEVQEGISFTLTDCESEGTVGKVTHSSGATGSGVKIEGNLTMYGGSITGNMAETRGGGIYIYKTGTFTMYDGIISENAATASKNMGCYGGGVCNVGGAFTMYDGTISGNNAAQGGGVYSSVSGVVNMSGGSISGNTAKIYGGGILNMEGSFTMTAGSITGNKVTSSEYGNGGGVYNLQYGTFTMSGGTITRNTSANVGGGVSNSSTFTMSDEAVISYNEAANKGGGIYNSFGAVNMNGGTITNNTASEGGGVYHSYGDSSAMIVSGASKITGNGNGNTESNLYIYGSNWPVTAGSLSNGARIGVSAPTADTGTLVKNSTDATVFSSDLSGYKLVSNEKGNGLKLEADPGAAGHNNHCICVGNAAGSEHQHDYNVKWTAWDKTDSLPDTAGNYYLTDNVTMNTRWKPVKSTVLCLNGHSITCTSGTNDKAVSAISVESGAAFILTDCSKDENGNNKGKITHSAGAIGRGVYNSGTFYLYGGNITGNNSGSASFIGGGVMNHNGAAFVMYGGRITQNIAEHGGGVYNSPMEHYPDKQTVFKMYGGTISGNQANRGGGVYNQCDFIMEGGTIGGTGTADSNTATDQGGGVYLSSSTSGTLTMKSGSIIGNAAASGGGVFVDVNKEGTAISELIVSGNVNVTDNKANGKDDNVYLGKSTDETKTASIEIDGALTGNAKIGVSAAKIPTDSTPVDIVMNASNSDVSYFVSDNSDYVIACEDGKLWLKTNANPTPAEHKHYLCGTNHTEAGDHKSDTQTEFTAWTKTDSLPDTAGSYYLTENVILTAATEYKGRIGYDYCGWDVPDGVVLCLNGKTITMQNPADMTDDVDVIKVSGHFTLTDCKTGNEQGEITHATASSGSKYDGKGVKVIGGSFDMFGGIITGNTSDYDTGGSGVCVVSHETNKSEFKLYGGKITGNTAKNGGGVEVSKYIDEQPAVFYMYGGSISGNTAAVEEGWESYGNGGGVYVSHMAEFVMTGGTISGNTATESGGGVYASAFAKYYKNGTSNAATLNVSGNAIISDNTVDNNANNVYLDSDTSEFDTISATLKINNPLTGKIGVTAGAAVPVIIATGADSDADYSTVITSDNADYNVVHNSSNKSELMFVSTAAPEHHWSEKWSADDTYHWHECTDADCTEINGRAEHTGGTATCTEKAACSVCKAPYGNVLDHDFGGEYKYSAAGHWQECQREGCNEAGSITDHVYDNNSDTTCNICGYVRTVKPGNSGKKDNVINKTEDKNAGTAASTTATIRPSTTTSGEKKTTTATVDNITAGKIIDKAVSNKSAEVIINTLTKAGISEAQAGTAAEIALPEKTVKELSEKTEASLIIRADAAEITLNKEAIDGLAAQAGTDGYVRLIVEIIKQDSNTLEAELKLVTSKGTVTDFKGGNVSVMVKLNDALAAKDLVCVYIDDSGIYHMINGAKNSDGTYSFMTGHFSTYAVMARSEAEKVIAEQNADRATELVKSVKLKARSAKTAKGNIRVTLSVTEGRDSIKALEDLGYTVKYRYYRSTSRAKNYKSMLEGAGKTYINTAGKKGTKYFYKARLTVYDAQGRLIAKTELKQCRYACRVK